MIEITPKVKLLSFSRSSPRDTRMSRTLPHDIRTQSGLTQLYNRRVTSAQRVRRPLGNGQHMLGDLSHSGVVVTTNDGGRWLVHKVSKGNTNSFIHSFSQSVSWSVGQAVSRSVSPLVSLSASQSISQTFNQTSSQMVNR